MPSFFSVIVTFPCHIYLFSEYNNPCHADYFFVPHSSPNFYPVNLHHSSCKHVFSIRVENTVDTDQTASSKKHKSGISRTTVMKFNSWLMVGWILMDSE